MENDKFLKNQRIELLRKCFDVPPVPKGTVGVITHVYQDGTIRLASNVGSNWQWEIYLHHTSKFSDTIKNVDSEE